MEHPIGSNKIQAKGQKRTEGLKNDVHGYYHNVRQTYTTVKQSVQNTKPMRQDPSSVSTETHYA